MPKESYGKVLPEDVELMASLEREARQYPGTTGERSYNGREISRMSPEGTEHERENIFSRLKVLSKEEGSEEKLREEAA